MQPPDQPNEAPAAPEPVPRRRVVFPWAWVGLLAGARVAFQATDFADDFKTMATMASIALGTIGLCLWYAFRGRGPLPVRLLVGVAPFALFYGCNTLYEARHSGDGWIVALHRRGAPKPDERLDTDVGSAAPIDDWGPGDYDYPAFLGGGPWAEALGPPLATDWSTQPPEEVWRRPVGAGWSGFAILGRYAVTQEQRGDQELVVCYDTLSGAPMWSHADTVRFDPQDVAGQMGRSGPRATPTIVGDRIYTQGATGIVNCLNARTGEPVWSVDTTERYGAAVPVWGKSGSPLYTPAEAAGGRALVVVNVGAPAGSTEGGYDASLVAFDAAEGDEVWHSGWRQTSYASPWLFELAGTPQVLQAVDDSIESHAADDGRLLWEHPWPGTSNDRPSCSQPIPVGDDRLLLTKGYGHGASLIAVRRRSDGVWETEPLWSPPVQPNLETKFSNVVVRDGFAYGLDGTVLQCVEVASGRVAWKHRRRPSPGFGFGQVLLAGDTLLILTEDGKLVLAAAAPDGYREHADLQALSPEETCWNTLALAGDLLLVRNSVEAVAYRLPLVEAEMGP